MGDARGDGGGAEALFAEQEASSEAEAESDPRQDQAYEEDRLATDVGVPAEHRPEEGGAERECAELRRESAEGFRGARARKGL